MSALLREAVKYWRAIYDMTPVRKQMLKGAYLSESGTTVVLYRDFHAETRRFIEAFGYDRLSKDCERGEAALTEFSRTFDRVVPDSFRVPADLLARCADELDPAVREAFTESIRRRRAVAESEADLAMASVEVADGDRRGLLLQTTRDSILPNAAASALKPCASPAARCSSGRSARAGGRIPHGDRRDL